MSLYFTVVIIKGEAFNISLKEKQIPSHVSWIHIAVQEFQHYFLYFSASHFDAAVHLSLRNLSLLSFVNRCGSQTRLIWDDRWFGNECCYLKCTCSRIHVLQITQSHADLGRPCESFCVRLCVLFLPYMYVCVLILQHTDPLKGLNWVYQGQWDSRTDTHIQWSASTDSKLKPCGWKAIHASCFCFLYLRVGQIFMIDFFSC